MTIKLTRREPCMHCGVHSQATKLERDRIVAALRASVGGREPHEDDDRHIQVLWDVANAIEKGKL